MIVRLLVSNNKSNVRKVVLRSDTVIGRSSDCNLRIASKEVSRKHCSILVSESVVLVRDLGSSNGTYLDGRRIEPNIDIPLPPDSELEIGNVRFVVQYNAPTDAEGSTAEVPNAVLIAKLEAEHKSAAAANAGVATQQTSAAEKPPVSAAGESPGVTIDPESTDAGSVDSQDGTINRVPGETIRDAESQETVRLASPPGMETVREPPPEDATIDQRSESVLEAEPAEGSVSVDDDTFALKESEVPDVEQNGDAEAADTGRRDKKLPDVDETISMTADDPRPVAKEDAAPPRPEPEKPKGWKSLFGLFGKKTANVDEAPPEAPDVRPETGAAPSGAVDETLPLNLPDDAPQAPEIPSSAADNETISLSSDESLVPDDPPNAAIDAESQDDSNLQDFFRQMSEE